MTTQIISITVSETLGAALDAYFDSERSLLSSYDDEVWEIHYNAWRNLVEACGSEDVARFLCQHTV